MNKALQAIRSLAVEFGMTPSARTRLAVVPAGKAEDDEDAFFKAFA
jgi:phage terminase small subunit